MLEKQKNKNRKLKKKWTNTIFMYTKLIDVEKKIVLYYAHTAGEYWEGVGGAATALHN